MYLYKTRNRNPITTPVILVKLESRTSEISKVLAESDELVFDRIITLDVSEELIAIGNFTQKITDAVDEHTAGRVVLDQGLNLANDQIAELSWELDQLDVELLVVPEFLGVWASRLELVRHDSLPLIELVEPRLSPLKQTQKRVFDLIFTIPVFILLLPFYLLTGILVRATSSGPIFFNQNRIGAEGKAFTFYKFRTMRDGADKERLEVLGRPDEDMAARYKKDPRITPVGRVLRRFSIDELPQLLNVIRGEMSLVGPRPMLEEEVAQLEENHRRRHLIKPGLTGLWQISGRKETSWEERMLLDLYYVDQWSISTDIAILLKTFKVVIDGKGSW
jgi:exopolysaccharide biosynthesis polyprenyl glycosylphosphotransferase